MKAKVKAIVERLEQIKADAAGLAADGKTPSANLAEEAAGLGLELHALLKEAK